jgi:hypothetical protein
MAFQSAEIQALGGGSPARHGLASTNHPDCRIGEWSYAPTITERPTRDITKYECTDTEIRTTNVK